MKAVFFDAAGTLFSPRRPIGELYAQVAVEFGFDRAGDSAAAEQLQRSFRQTFAAAEPLHGGLLRGPDPVAAERRWWRGIVQRAFAPVGTVRRFDEFFEALYSFFGSGEAWSLEPGVCEALDRLEQSDLRLGVISNFDSRLPPLLGALGIAGFFDPVVYSARTEAAKPDPRIFRVALREAGITAKEGCHVGDRLRDDYQGARDAGLSAVLYDPWDRATGATRVGSWAELPPLLL